MLIALISVLPLPHDVRAYVDPQASSRNVLLRRFLVIKGRSHFFKSMLLSEFILFLWRHLSKLSFTCS